MATWLKSFIVITTGAMFSPFAAADVLEMPGASSERPQESVAHTVPGRGMTMEQVRNRFGSPQEKVPPVGEPPITRWEYGDFTVYFEHNLVLHSVVHEP